MNISHMFADWLFVLGSAAWMAAVEVQVEGGYGWSAKTATWRMKNPISKIVSWPYISGYHLTFWMFSFVMFHIPFLFEHALTIKNWLQMMELLWGFWMAVDFWWFVINPYWGIKKFFTMEIPWHPRKFLWLPTDYWVGFVILVGWEVLRQVVRG